MKLIHVLTITLATLAFSAPLPKKNPTPILPGEVTTQGAAGGRGGYNAPPPRTQSEVTTQGTEGGRGGYNAQSEMATEGTEGGRGGYNRRF
ncbi:hypothetical protein HYALB_00012864 [Hymenoscyphus albidus]|uniref:Uncharacterized protein n=1 Tax=Hymenoscyphus albidus TaxID=595503 RepID=A0A9N9M0C7_9HELO|nr:hypothetical protein HYALB_00012864 [Hymenoscyphus albidus]